MNEINSLKSPENREPGDYLLVTGDGSSDPKIEIVTVVQAITNDPGVIIAKDRFGRKFRTSWLHIRALPKTSNNN